MPPRLLKQDQSPEYPETISSVMNSTEPPNELEFPFTDDGSEIKPNPLTIVHDDRWNESWNDFSFYSHKRFYHIDNENVRSFNLQNVPCDIIQHE